MAQDYSKFDNAIDVEGLKNDLDDIEKGNKKPNDDEVPVGDYEVKIVKMELVASKKSGDPMVSIWFEILAGEYKGRYLFLHQIITQGWQLHIMNTFLRSLDSGVEVKFDTYKQYGAMLLDIHEAINDKLEYLLSYTKDKKDFSVFTIKEIYDVIPEEEKTW